LLIAVFYEVKHVYEKCAPVKYAIYSVIRLHKTKWSIYNKERHEWLHVGDDDVAIFCRTNDVGRNTSIARALF